MQHHAVVGSGFVGSFVADSLRARGHRVTVLNSRSQLHDWDIDVDQVTIAAPSAVKWYANAHADEDAAALQTLMNSLLALRTRRTLLYSTVDVYAEPVRVTESDDLWSTAPYGRHRRQLEAWVVETCTDAHVVRLPALVGPGLRKNVFFDLCHRHRLEAIVPAARFQWYSLEHLMADTDVVLARGLGTVNFVSEPLETADLVSEVFPDLVGLLPHAIDTDNSTTTSAPSYDVHSEYAGLWGSSLPYQRGLDEVLAFLRDARSELEAGS